jgi:diguanylate cyclase (GGDEF)-like protein
VKERRQFEVIESRQMDHLRVFHDVARALTSSLELEEILGAIMDKMAQFFGPERWSMLMVDDKCNELYYAIAVGENTESLKGLRVPMGEGVAGWVASTGNPLIVPDVALDPHWSAFANKHPDLKIKSIACVPVRSGNKTLGVIQLLNSKLDLLSEYSISFLRILCDYAAIAIQNARSMTLIQELTITDDVTGLFNARHLYTLLDEQVAQGRVFSLMFVDLDHFKSVNDTHGHLIGSRLLAEIGSLLRRSLGPNNAAFRYGGDEFVALLPGMGKSAASGTTMALRGDLRGARFLEGAGLSLSVSGSFGLATYPEDGNTVPTILRAADTMMYEAKVTRDNVAIAGKGLVERATVMAGHGSGSRQAVSGAFKNDGLPRIDGR